jgi:uncharacterized membrane protein AbrB (regulator of aidB expression)
MTKSKVTEGQTTQWPKKRDIKTSNTMAKRTETEGPATQLSFCPFLLVIVLLVLLSFYFGDCVAFPSALLFWPLCCFSFWHFLLVIVLLVVLSFSFGHCVACPSVLNGQKKRTEGQVTQWPKEKDRRTSNTMAKRKGQKDKQHNGQTKNYLSFCHFLLGIVLLVLLSLFFGHCVVCPSVLFLSVIVLLVLLSLFFGHKEKGQKVKQHNGQKKMTEGQATQ